MINTGVIGNPRRIKKTRTLVLIDCFERIIEQQTETKYLASLAYFRFDSKKTFEDWIADCSLQFKTSQIKVACENEKNLKV